MDGGVAIATVQRFKILEALLEEYSKNMTRESARLRLALLRHTTPETRTAALAWFDLRWPQ